MFSIASDCMLNLKLRSQSTGLSLRIIPVLIRMNFDDTMYNRSEILGEPEQTMLNRLMSAVVLNDGSHREGCQRPV